MFLGNYPAKIDEKGRLKIPTKFRFDMQERYGSQVFVTSRADQGAAVHIYPLSVWEEEVGRNLAPLWENQLALVSEEKRKQQEAQEWLARQVTYYGQPGEIDKQGRVSIHARLRESAAMAGDVDVLGLVTHLEVWNRERLSAHMATKKAAGADAGKPSGRDD